ncbi:phosphoribosyltransferase [Pandoraea soli]
MPFIDRADAARQLAKALNAYSGKHPLILAVPRGGVPIGAIVADALGGDLDIVLVRKLGAPGNPELAVGAVDESGWTYLTPYAKLAGGESAYVEHERMVQLDTLRRRRARFTPGRPRTSADGRVAIVVDDGIATGASIIAALHSVRQLGPARLICAVPVAPPDALRDIAPYADEVICLETPADFSAVGAFYRKFPQVSDDEVVACLRSR